MSVLPEFYNESENNTIVEYLVDSSIIQDDYKKLKHENESYQQELHVLRLKLKTSYALEKELHEANETLEQLLAQWRTKATLAEQEMLAEREEKYRIEKEKYEDHITHLEADAKHNMEEITNLHEELRKYKYLINEHPSNPISIEDTLIPYKKKIEELTILLQNMGNKEEQLEKKLANMDNEHQELKAILKITKEQLAEKNEALENTREELAVNRMKLESLKIIPASDTCKGNSLFAEVEDRRQILLNKMKVLQDKYNEVKRMLNTKINEIKLLKAEHAMVRKWEFDAIDTLQENTDLLEKYKSRIFGLENKLKAEIKTKNQAKEILPTNDNFNYAQLLLAEKEKELKRLNEMIEKQAIQILVQEEAKNAISKNLRYWSSKAMSMEAQILAMKMQLESEQTIMNRNLLKNIENCKININKDFETTYDDLKITPDDFMSKNNAYQQNSTKLSGKTIIDKCINGKEERDEKILRFAMDTKDTENNEKKPLKNTKTA